MAHSPSRLVSAFESDWFQTVRYNWVTEPGLQRLRALLEHKLPYVPGGWQIEDTARLLVGDDVLCVSATGDGKSALFYMYSLVRSDTITVVLSPTNALELDMVENLCRLGISALAINSDTLAAAAIEGRDLWAEATACKHQIVFFSPETIGTPRFRTFIEDGEVRRRLGLFAVDECHLVDEWGADFRKAYARIKDVRPWLPAHTAFLALTATLEPGRQTKAVTDALGLRPERLHFDKRDCQRHNVDIVIRDLQYTSTTHEFRDLDWLIPSSMSHPSDVPKTLLYCESIELGHRVATYLRSLLPQSLKSDRNIVIRHLHSLKCSECKKDGLASLYQDGQARETAIHVTTDVLGVGMNMQDYDRVICFATPSSLAAMIQRIGRAARGRGRHGTGIVYIKKSDIQKTENYLQKLDRSPDTVRDSRLLVPQPKDLARAPELARANSRSAKTPQDSATLGASSKRGSKAACPSLQLVLAAHVRGVCISRQINAIYDNPGKLDDCGRCSSCRPSPNPDPRPISIPAPTTSHAPSQLAVNPNAVPRMYQLTAKDCEEVSRRLEWAAMDILLTHPVRDDSICIGPSSFLPQTFIDRITRDFLLITSEPVLRQRMTGWRFEWTEYGPDLWRAVCELHKEYSKTLHDRHEASLEKRRETNAQKREQQATEAARVHKVLEDAGLDKVRRVVLKVSTGSSDEAAGPSGAKENAVPPASDPLRSTLSANVHHTALDSTARSDPVCPLSPSKRQARDEGSAHTSPSPAKRVRRSTRTTAIQNKQT